MNYILKDGQPVAEPDVLAWAMWFQNTTERKIAHDKIGDAEISTVFLGVDHNFGGGAPILFETMVFGGALDEEQWRYHTREEAEAGHRAVVEQVKALPK